MRIVWLLILVLTAVPGLAQEGASGDEGCSDREICPIPFVKLSKPESDLFLTHGKVMDPERPDWNKYRDPIQRYNDVRSCLTEDQRNAPIPDLRKVNWTRLLVRKHEADVCMFRIATSLLTLEALEKWALSQDMKFSELARVRSENYRSRYPMEPRFGVEFGWTGDQYRELRPRSLLSFLDRGVYRYRIGIHFSESMEVSGADSATVSK